MPKDPHDGDTRDDRVIFLLNRLGEQLIRSEKERLALGAKLARLEQQQQAQAGSLARAENITKMVEEALASQGRLNRRLEQVNQDKIRINRKLERIEEAVVQTREALESKALVLLTGQGVAESSGKPQLPADMSQMAPVVRAAAGFRDKKFMGYAASLTAIVLITLLGAWSAIKLSTADSTDTPAVVAQAEQTQAPASAPVPTETAAATTPAPAPEALPAPDTTAQTSAAAAPMPEQPVASVAPPPPSQPRPVMIHVARNDVPTPPPADEPDSDSAASTDALAATLNEVAPSSGGAIPENLEKAAPPPPPAAVVATAKPVSFTPKADTKADTHADAGANPSAVETFISQQHDSKPLAQRAQPDPSLPALAQQIEKKAIEGIPEAQHDLAALYTAGQAGVATDYKKAAFWFREAAVGGVANARYNLGVLYQQGLGVERDLNKAISWYRAAAKLGHPEAEYNLGIAYIEGVGATYSPQIAARYFHQAANGGVVEADYNLGLVYENGLLGKPDRQEALYWYKRGADRDNKQAAAALAQLEKVMKLSSADADKLIKGMHNDEAAQTPVPDEKTAPAKTAETKTPDEKAAAVASGDGPDAADADDNPVALNQPLPVTGDTAAPAHDNGLTAQIQEQLIKRGLFPGPADGSSSAQMSDAIRAYQSANGLASDGRATQALLAHMLSSEIKSPAADGTPKKTSSAAGANGLNPNDLLTPTAGAVSN